MPPENGDPHEFTYSIDQGTQLGSAIAEAISWVTGTDVLDIEPLAYVVDPEGLQRLFTGGKKRGDFYRSSAGSTEEYPQVSFEYEGYLVTVYPGRFTVEPVSEAPTNH